MKEIKFNSKSLFSFWVYRMSLSAHAKIGGMKNYKVLMTDDVKRVFNELMKLDTYQIVTLGEAIHIEYERLMEPYIKLAGKRNQLVRLIDEARDMGFYNVRSLETMYKKAKEKYNKAKDGLYGQCLGESNFDGIEWREVQGDKEC